MPRYIALLAIILISQAGFSQGKFNPNSQVNAANGGSGNGPAIINVITPLKDNDTFCEGNTMTLSISATSDSSLEYLWTHNGTLVGGNSPILTISNLTVAKAGTYQVEIKEMNTSNTTAQVCEVVVNAKPVLTTDLNGGNSPICAGSSIMLNCVMTNVSSVELYKSGTSISMGNMYTDTSAGPSDSGVYQFMGTAMPKCMDLKSSSFMQVVKSPGSITTQPKSMLLRDAANMTYVMKVKLAGDGPFGYQWYKDGNSLTGQNADSFKIFSYNALNDSGNYHVEIYQPAPCTGSILSDSAHISSTDCPILVWMKYNNSVSSRVLSPEDTSFVVCNGEVLKIDVSAVGVGGYQWYKNDVAILGALSDEYTVVPATNDVIGTYHIVLTPQSGVSSCPVTMSQKIKVSTTPKQVIVTQPMPNPSCHTAAYTIKVNADNSTMFQWYKDNVAIAGATSSSHPITGIDFTRHEYYVLVMHPACSTVVSHKVNVARMDPNTMAKTESVDRMDLMEQCTDSLGWTYYTHASDPYAILFGLRKNGNEVVFSPDVTRTSGFIKELAPDEYVKKGVLLGMRMYNMNVKSGSVTKPYDVKFYFDKGKFEEQAFLDAIRTKVVNYTEFSTNLPTTSLSFLTSTQDPMNLALLLAQNTYPLKFENTIISTTKFGTENNVKFAEISNLTNSKGGGTFYFDYYKKSTGGINGSSDNNLSIYPNPSNGIVSFGATLDKNASISVYDVLGKEVKRFTNLTKTSIDCSELMNGNYIIQLNNQASTTQSKLTIAK